MKHGVRRVLVICPNRVIGVWVQEFHTHSPLHVQCIIWDAKGRRRPLPKRISPYDLQVVIVNFEAFGTPGKRLPSGRRSRKTGRFATREKIRTWVNTDPTPAAAIIDEGHKIKAPSGKSSTAIISMRDLFDYRLLLTGTPVTKAHRIHDIFMQWQWVNPNRFRRWGPTAEAFREHVGVWTQRNGFPQWLRAKPRGVEDARRGMHMDGMVVRRSDCFDLPERMPNRIIPVKLSARTAKAYDDMAETMIAEIEEGIIAEASIPLVVMLRLQQITSGFVGITADTDDEAKRRAMAKTHRIGTEKLDALQELLVEEYLDRWEEEKVIVAAKYKHDLNDITRMVAGLDIKQFTIRGGMARWETDDQVSQFRRYRGMALMLVQPDAASLGIDLSSASHMVWYSLTNSWVNWTQCCDRIALSDQSTTFTYLQVPGSIDTLMYEGLINDTNVARYIMKRPSRLRLKK